MEFILHAVNPPAEFVEILYTILPIIFFNIIPILSELTKV
jgi:hypothetical protein